MPTHTRSLTQSCPLRPWSAYVCMFRLTRLGALALTTLAWRKPTHAHPRYRAVWYLELAPTLGSLTPLRVVFLGSYTRAVRAAYPSHAHRATHASPPRGHTATCGLAPPLSERVRLVTLISHASPPLWHRRARPRPHAHFIFVLHTLALLAYGTSICHACSRATQTHATPLSSLREAQCYSHRAIIT